MMLSLKSLIIYNNFIEKGKQMQFIKKYIFNIMRFLAIWLTIYSLYNMYNNIGDQKANTAIFLISLSLTFTIMMAEFWYKPRN